MTHIDHPLRHWDRTCPACQKECPYPITMDDGSAEDCIAEGHCGCVLGLHAPDAARDRQEGK